jgi:ribonuclease HI
MALTREQAELALKYGWKKSTLLEVDGWLDANCSAITYQTPQFVILNEKYHVYRRLGLKPLLKYGHLTEVVAYCDGSGTNPRNAAGAGVFIQSTELEDPLHLSFGLGNGTNNFAEIWAIHIAIMHIPSNQAKITIKSDSLYSIGALTNGSWQIKLNQELISGIKADLRFRPNVSFEKVKAHSGVYGNEMADCLAGVARKYGTVHPGWI